MTATYKTIPDLVPASAVTGSDKLEIDQGGSSRSITVDQLLDVPGGDYLALAGGTLSGPLTGTAATFSATLTANQVVSSSAADPTIYIVNTGNAANQRLFQFLHWSDNSLYIRAVDDATVPIAAGLRLQSGGALTVGGALATLSATAVGAGSAAQAFIKASSTADLGLYFGTGAPTFNAAKGSIYTNTTATTTTTRLYVNTSGTNTWTNLTTAA